MKRQLIQKLALWKNKKNRKPLILMGVRQVGKTYLLETFGKNYFTRYHIINFEKWEQARALFKGNLNPKALLNDLQFLLNTSINIQEDLLIFDEIQACPLALTSLKYFCEELPELALACAGSLLGLHLSEESYPVGKVDMLHLYPMSFEEFLEGIGDQLSIDYLAKLTLDQPPSPIAHQHLWDRLKQYFVTGGLPEVVALFSEQQDNLFNATQAVREKQETLITAYYADIAKHAGKVNAMHIDRTWNAVPTQLFQAQEGSAPKFKFKNILPNIRSYAQLANVIDWLTAAELVIKIPIVDTINKPLSAFTKDNRFKLFLFDIGILGAMSGLSPKTILDYGYGTYQGCFAENFVIQQLIASGQQHIVSWEEGRAEVEFLIEHNNDFMPIEVKSGRITRAKSLQQFIEKYHPKKSIILSALVKKNSSSALITHLPLYLASAFVSIQHGFELYENAQK